ncbi:MAG: hypothetical protein RIE73_04300 [Coleofasciculus sp. C1-SOL-03]|uniref:hypothetical protein n=1 Tax=Coleofasciculus sp. C1-SOL-03 TaxID=3069522 RepID=UPI0032F0BDD5
MERLGFRESVGAGLGTKFIYSPITEQQNPPFPTDNGTAKPVRVQDKTTQPNLVKGDPIKLRGWVLLIYAAGRPYNRLYYFGLNLVNKNDLNLYFL